MSIDGSFNLESALKRFLARCPKLGCVPQFDSLSKKGDKVTEEDIVNCVAELFLHPNYTIPLVGCFRPIARKIVDKAVALLRLVPNLRLNSDNTVPETRDIDAAEVVSFLENYVRSGRGLNLHELACLAFSRALDLAPNLLGSVLTYFKFAPPPFERILLKGTTFDLSTRVVSDLVQATRTSYRLLIVEPEVFSELWDWSCFFDLVEKFSDINLRNAAEFDNDIVNIRWCGVQILSLILKMSDRATMNFGIGAEEALSCLLRWEEFCLDVALEKAGWYTEPSEQLKSGSVDEEVSFNQENCLQSVGLNSLVSSRSSEVEPLVKSRRDNKSSAYPFVLTSAVRRSFEVILLAVSQKWPVLLYGPAGSGKSTLVCKLARDSGNQVLSIHMDDQIDGKTLIGSYVCAEQPGEFRWQPGSLTQAVSNGFWIVLEDIDRAPLDVQSILLPLLEGSRSFVTGQGEEIKVAESFRLFSTISTSKLDLSRGQEGGNFLGTLWRRVMIRPASNEDLQNIVKAWYPNLEPLSEKLIETFGRVNFSPLHQHVEFESGDPASSTYPSRFSLRDLLKWCKRIAGLDLSVAEHRLWTYECHRIYQEAVDVFASFSSSFENRSIIMKEIAKLWAVPVPEMNTLHFPSKPIIQDTPSELRIGRVALQHAQRVIHDKKWPFVEISSTLHALERIASSVKYNEPVLLVGETGTGKTTLVQNLASWLGHRLTVLNLSQQSDVADLLGGFKPMDARFICVPLYEEFRLMFCKTFSLKSNEEVFTWFTEQLSTKNWGTLLSGFQKSVDAFRKKYEEGRYGSAKKRKKPLDEENLKAWENFAVKLDTARRQIASSGMVFSFVEGAFVTALRNGEWILLDEVNLAPPETLQRIIGVLEGENGSLCLAERGDVSQIYRHPNFRIFACMNPATDAGKRELPYAIRSRFTEYFVDDVLDDKDLTLFVNEFLEESRSDSKLLEKIISFYRTAKRCSEERLQDGANQKPQYSLRSLYRALEYTRKAKKKFGFRQSVYDGFSMFFLTLLDRPSAQIMNRMIYKDILELNEPPHVPFDAYLMIKENSKTNGFLKNYVLTKSVKEHLRNLSRAIFIKRYPVLLQGPTSSGKTSLVQYLAAVTGHEFVRINNHEHTDLQEYLGSYITDASGKLVFHEGVLVKAVRSGYWIVLDELNLAPSDVLEALNRLLDDNRELFVPELLETIKAHPEFMLFATQNPPTFYGGRKMLSRAFRNRFVEVHVDEIPDDELSTILEQRSEIPESYAKKMVEIMKELQLHRQTSKVFAGKHGYITPRDLFRWADRFRAFGKSYEDLAIDGYYLLAERLREDGEKRVVQDVLERHLRVKLVKDELYRKEGLEGDPVQNLRSCSVVSENLRNVILTESMWRLYFLVRRCYELREPVLLVGETGGGKTTVCQLLSISLGLKLHILNCHQYTETSDFLGGFYPLRDRSKLLLEFEGIIEQLRLSKVLIYYPEDYTISSDIGRASSTLYEVDKVVNSYRQGLVSCPHVNAHDVDAFEQMKVELSQLYQKWQTIFMWQDGPLVEAMKAGDLFLVDEISLADDSVLERLNSVLEPEKKLSLAEKGGTIMEKITAHRNFLVLATMNPGGDYGKKELSPALRNRFTEIWVPSVSDINELRCIAMQRLSNPKLSHIVDPMLNFWEWFNQSQVGRVLTIRDLLSWVAFINVTERDLGPEYALLHGVFLVLLDGLSLGTGICKEDGRQLRERCLFFLLELLKKGGSNVVCSKLSRMESYGWGNLQSVADISSSSNMLYDGNFGIDPFYITRGHENCEVGGFDFLAPTTRRNALRVLRAMQLPKPVLLEGSPGVGKTSLIVALGKFSGHRVVRINLSEQTDIMDLLGSDLPVESDDGMKFAWSDGILLQALKEGCWVLLDELNLAPQSVLEGLNAILDHRAEVFIPELNLTFKCPSTFRVFACQNPSYQGGGRKGLPKSFLNRFTKVYVDELVEHDYLFICTSLYPSIPRPVLSKVISFNRRLHEDTMLHHRFAQDGSPWEFNLRDVIRSCQIIQGAGVTSFGDSFLRILYVQRMRTPADRREVLKLYEQVFGVKPVIDPYPRVHLTPRNLVVGNTAIKRNYVQSSRVANGQLKIFPGIRHSLEAAVHCVQHQWLCILVGPPSSGKTSLIRILAQLTGNALNELNLSSTTDISELIGCFEQYNAFHNFRLVVAEIENYINEYCSLQLETSMEAFMKERKELVSRWLSILSDVICDLTSGSPLAFMENWNSSMRSLSLLAEIIEQLKRDLGKNVLPVSWSTNELNRTMKTILKLQAHQKRPHSVKFEWVTGQLIKAIENGEWIVLENANLCNPTVLDRINSLVEPSGTITVNECGNIDGRPVVLHPHPNFRMFLTVDPRFGEVSRAMRNRGVEIFMMQPYWLFDNSSNDSEIKDVKRFLALSGIPGDKLVDSMARAHVYAKVEGLRYNINITYLELERWVQLFQQLLISGNQPMWSLHISWEHTYLSSFGAAYGGNIISQVKNAYLLGTELFESDASPHSCLSLPGGWPRSFKLKDFLWYSKECSVQQNCMYLEYLGAQYASCRLRMNGKKCPVDQALVTSGHAATYLMDMKMLQHIMFPKDLNVTKLDSVKNADYNFSLANQMLLFAANWVIEQATESDLQLYSLWFSWFGFQLQPYCQFFTSFLSALRQELKHQVWGYIFHYHQQLMSLNQVDIESRQIPMLSLDLVNLNASADRSNELLCRAINCVELLRLSYQQWNAESEHDYTNEARCFIPFFKSLRCLEEEVLNMLVESPSFEMLVQLYSKLVENHILFWNCVTSSQFEHSQVPLRSLLKDVIKLQEFCRTSVKIVLVESKNLGEVSFWKFCSEKSLLWVHGGHPFPPRSAELYHQQSQLCKFCDLVWPMRRNSLRQVDDCFVEVAASSNPEFRFLSVEGLCMSSYIMAKRHDEDDLHVKQLEEMNQMLLKRFEHEKDQLKMSLGSDEHVIFGEKSDVCCVFWPEIMCGKSGFDSWQDTLPIVDGTSCSMDMKLLQELSQILLIDAEGLQLALCGVSSLLESALRYSLTFSVRPAQNFVPHQKILWTLDAWSSLDSVHTKMASFVLEMWFWWHSFLWSHCPSYVQNFSKIDNYDVQLPDMLLQPVKAATVFHILQSPSSIKDYSVQVLKLKVASRDLWQSYLGTDLPIFLLSVARSLFQEIIYAHKKTFNADKFATIKSILQKNIITPDIMQLLSSLIASSSHRRLKSLVPLFIEPALRDLYLQCSSSDFHSSLGFAWLRIGGLRFCLVLGSDDIDPAMKYSYKCSRLQEKISFLELEIKVRQECEHLSGSFASRESGRRRAETLEKLRAEHRMLQRKVVFRPDPMKFKALKKECEEFLGLLNSLVGLVSNVHSTDMQQVAEQIHNWQETASFFIDRLSEEYAEYIDIAQPIQVAVYEMKLGLSLILSSTLQKQLFNRIDANVDHITEPIYSLVKFPRGDPSQSISVHLSGGLSIFSSHDIDYFTDICALDMSLLEKLTTLLRDLRDGKDSVFHLKASVQRNILVRVAHVVANAQLMDKASFILLDRIFNEFASNWMGMKVQIKAKEDRDAQQYKFKTRAFKLESIFEVDKSAVSNLFGSDNFSEWQDLLPEEELSEKMEAGDENGSLEEEWNLVEESTISGMVDIHNQLFGSTNLVLSPGTVKISDAERLVSFIDSYTLGIGMIRGLGGLFSSSLDAKFAPEHLFRLCLEHQRLLVSSYKPDHIYNFYKDSNAPVIAKMVKPLTTLKQRILTLPCEWEDHPGPKKILDVIEMLLALPSTTPLAKALAGLQFLLNRARVLQENGVKLPLSDQLEPIFALMCSWQKMEFDTWPALIDDVQDQYERNAGKLWFPLYAVIQHKHSTDVTEYDQSAILSLEEFIQTSSIGEFRKRLKLLFAFLGQINTGRHLGVYSSPWQENNLNILYNVFGFYVQGLPIVMEHIEANRRKIETELKDLLKLCRWERFQSYLSVDDSFRRTRQKLRKLIQKYTDALQEPVMLILNQEAVQNGVNVPSLGGHNPLSDISDMNVGLSNSNLGPTQMKDVDRCIWYVKWRERVSGTLQSLHLRITSELCFLSSEDVSKFTRQGSFFLSGSLLYPEEWRGLWKTIENICRTTVDCGELWKDAKRSVGKKRAFSELLKLLERSGLHRHKMEVIEISKHSSWLFCQPSYDAQHLLLTWSRLPHAAVSVADGSELQQFPKETSDNEWKAANEFYFKSLAAVQLLQQICLKQNEDVSSEQANRSISFLNHLIIIQHMQRDAAYSFAKKLNRLHESVSALEKLYSNCTGFDSKTLYECLFAQNQHATFKFMWQQKQLFDTLYTMLLEGSLLLRTVENAHLDSCQSVKPAASRILAFVEKFIPLFLNSKESLDKHLLGHSGTISTVPVSFRPCVISREDEEMVFNNVQAIKEFEEQLLALRKQDLGENLVVETLLSRFDDVLKKGKLMAEQFTSALQSSSADSCEKANSSAESSSELKAQFGEALSRTFDCVINMLQKLDSFSNDHTLSEEALGKITSWETILNSCVGNLGVDKLCDQLVEAITCAEKLVNFTGSQVPILSYHVGTHFKHLHDLVNLILSFGDGFMQDFIAMHKTVSAMTHMLANVLASLFSKGFGIPSKDETDDTGHDIPQDASGTGMGEGAGAQDVSDQINDEDQLLGTMEKAGEEQDASHEEPSKNDKGIEMEEDFAADTFSVSEDSEGDNEEDGEDEQLESTMGDTGAHSEVVDEKLWNKEEDENPTQRNEKYESGSSVQDKDTSSRELRAKEDSAATADELGELDSDELAKQNDAIENSEDPGDTESIEDTNVDKDEAFADPTGLKLDEVNQDFDEDTEMDENEADEGTDPNEAVGAEDHDESAENGRDEEEDSNQADETMEEAEHEQVDEASERDDSGKQPQENPEINTMVEMGNSHFLGDQVPNAESATQPNWSDGQQNHFDAAPLRSLPFNNPFEMNTMVSDSSTGQRFSNDQQKTQFPRQESVQKTQANPYRNIGDALEEWKERVNVTVDLQADNKESQGEIEDENAEEYGYVPESEKGMSQALGPATSEQVDSNLNGKMPDEGNRSEATKNDVSDMEMDKQNSENPLVQPLFSILKSKMEEQMNGSYLEKLNEEPLEVPDHHDGDSGSLSGSLISVKKSYLNEDAYQLSKLSLGDDNLGKALDLEDNSHDSKSNSTALWRRYELRTTKLSQELAEQLRLVMEPTLASKLQGDYKTGKRINMKKVIPYIASHYRKDKIWLRRTRPNKRDYQVVIAVDDSRSMSESGCGDVAIEALVTVCRAMSQLEMGNLAVASFGKKGNIRLLHDFDRPFTGEAGVKMVSSLTFEQENTIADEPVLDLLTYLNNMMDAAVAKARLSSGQNPLQQLVLIIGDGRFHEKEKLRRCVRDVLSKKRMVAFLLLDSPQESIIDLKELSFQGRDIKVSKYLDSFPFPYYIVLRNIEALPRTLADLLRQWFEIMQNSRD